MNDHTNDSIQSDLKVTRKGGLLIFKTRTATITMDDTRLPELIQALIALAK